MCILDGWVPIFAIHQKRIFRLGGERWPFNPSPTRLRNQSELGSIVGSSFSGQQIGVKRATGERASAVSVFRTQTQLAMHEDHKMARHFGEMGKYYGITVRVVGPNIVPTNIVGSIKKKRPSKSFLTRVSQQSTLFVIYFNYQHGGNGIRTSL